MLTVGFSSVLFIRLRKSPSISSLLCFYHTRMLGFVKCFSEFIEIIRQVLSFILLIKYITLSQTCIPMLNSIDFVI